MVRLFSLPFLAISFSIASAADLPTPDKFDDTGFVSIFNGKDLTGWTVSAKTGHSGASKNKSGGKWVAENGIMLGSQDIKGNGGIIITDKKYNDFEVVLEMQNDDGPDSGLFLRSSDTGKCYQAMIDYHKGGNLMGIYGEGIGGKPNVFNFSFLDTVKAMKVVEYKPFPCPVTADEWPKFWVHGEWNELRARIQGNPPRITTWVKGVKFMDFTDTEKRLGDTGGIALQVHGGGDYTKQFVRYRNLRVKELAK